MANKSPTRVDQKIDWKLANLVLAFRTSCDLARGEEKTLTPEEVEEINTALMMAHDQLEVVKGLFAQARQRGGMRK